jgi:hypothetical protein
MSDEITWPTMKRSVELGARFLIKKPHDAKTINDLWQHLDTRNRREKIEDIFQGWSNCIRHIFTISLVDQHKRKPVIYSSV